MAKMAKMAIYGHIWTYMDIYGQDYVYGQDYMDKIINTAVQTT